jgi:calcineurin-like phosphoesterase family protein
MVNLSKTINENTFIISDTHLSHYRVLQFEPIRVNFLSDYNNRVSAECKELLKLYETISTEDRRNSDAVNTLCKHLILFHDQMIYEKWNSVVTENDTVLHLGDFTFSGIIENTRELNGKKILLRGNHDLKSKYTYIDAGWADVIESFVIVIGGEMFEMLLSPDKYWNGLITDINGQKILFSHYPIKNSIIWDIKKYGPITDLLEKIYETVGCQVNIHGHTHSKKSVYDKSINVSMETILGMQPIRIGELLELNGYKN